MSALIRRWWPAMTVTVMGAALIAFGLVRDQTAGSVAVEIGGSLTLVPVLVLLERQLEHRLVDKVEQRVDEFQADVQAEVDRVSSEVRELGARINTSAERALRLQRDADEQLLAAFTDQRTVEALLALRDRCNALNISPNVDVYPDRKYAVLLQFHGDHPRFGIWKIGKVAGGEPARDGDAKAEFYWSAGLSFDRFNELLLEHLLAQGLYPGDDSFTSFDMVGAIVDRYRDKLRGVFGT